MWTCKPCRSGECHKCEEWENQYGDPCWCPHVSDFDSDCDLDQPDPTGR